MATEEPLPAAQVDLYVAPAADAEELAARGVPVVTWGPAGRLRGAFLAGSVDFLREPWQPEELEMRAFAILARARRLYEFPWGEVSLEGNTLRTPGGDARLTRHQSVILRALLRSRGNPVPREALALLSAGRTHGARSRAVDVQVAAIRRKVRSMAPAAGQFIHGVRGQGYMIP